MSDIKTWPVYTSGPLLHLTSEALFLYLGSLKDGEIITDAAAQTIASWWHDGRNAYTLMLSSTGSVDRYVTLADFGTADDAESDADAVALHHLGAYIAHKQATAPSGCRPCACDDCMGLTYGTAGELCDECEEAGCSATERISCSAVDAYEESVSRCVACGEPVDCCQGHGETGDPVGHHTLELHAMGMHSRCITETGVCED